MRVAFVVQVLVLVVVDEDGRPDDGDIDLL